MPEVTISASDDPDDLTIVEWQGLDSAMGEQVPPAVHASVMTIARRIKADARRHSCSPYLFSEAPE